MNQKLIYKYVPVTVNSLKILINGQFWFGLPTNHNDPFEGIFKTKEYYSLPKQVILSSFYSHNSHLLGGQTVEKKLDQIETDYSIFSIDLYKVLKTRLEKNYGVSCFTTVRDNILMWSHYASSHQGFCLIFDKNHLIENIKYPKSMINFESVDYQNDLIEAELIIEKRQIGFKNERKILFRKSKLWKYEKEIRLIAFLYGNTSNNLIKFDKKSIRGIIFGEKMTPDDKDTIIQIINSDHEYYDVKFFKALKDINTFKVKIEKN